MVRRNDKDDDGVKKRYGEQLVHEKFPVRKKMAVPLTAISSFVVLVGWFFNIGWLPWASADALEKHNTEDARAWKTEIHKHEANAKHHGAVSVEEYKSDTGRMREEIEGIKISQKAQGEKIQEIQVQVVKMQSDVGHIMTGINDLKTMMRRDNR